MGTRLVISRADTAGPGTTQPMLLPTPARGVMSNAKAGDVWAGETRVGEGVWRSRAGHGDNGRLACGDGG